MAFWCNAGSGDVREWPRKGERAVRSECRRTEQLKNKEESSMGEEWTSGEEWSKVEYREERRGME